MEITEARSGKPPDLVHTWTDDAHRSRMENREQVAWGKGSQRGERSGGAGRKLGVKAVFQASWETGHRRRGCGKVEGVFRLGGCGGAVPDMSPLRCLPGPEGAGPEEAPTRLL